jgi:hypothetical protein
MTFRILIDITSQEPLIDNTSQENLLTSHLEEELIHPEHNHYFVCTPLQLIY